MHDVFKEAMAPFLSQPLFTADALVAETSRLKRRIAELEADLDECREFLKDQMNVVDGDYGQPAPNRAMQLVTMIDQTLYEPEPRA